MPDIDTLFAGVPVVDFDAAVAWYTRLYVVGDDQCAGQALVALSVVDLDGTLEDSFIEVTISAS